MPKSRSPHGIQFDSPLQRQWMIRSSSGRLALKAATVCGASSSSQRATKRIPAATISSTVAKTTGGTMTRLRLDISMSLDGFIAGPNRTVEQPLGDGGIQLHEWIFGLASWRESHGQTGGTKGIDDDIVKEQLAQPG